MRKIYLMLGGLAMTYLSYGQCTEINEWDISLSSKDRTSLTLQLYSPNKEGGNATGGDDLYTVEWGVKGFSLGSGTVDAFVPDDAWFNRMYEGLSLETTYEFYIKEACDAGETSYVGPIEFTTDGECADFPNVNYGGESSATSVSYCGLESKNPGATYRVQLVQDPWGSPIVLETRMGNAPDEYCEEFSGLTESTSYGIHIKEFCTNGDSTELHMGQANTVATCAGLSSFGEDEAGINSAAVYYYVYEHQLGETLSVEYGESPLTPGTGQTISFTLEHQDSTIHMDGLNPETTYDFIATITCASGSDMTSQASITTISECATPEMDGGVAFHDKVKLYTYARQVGQQYTVIYGPEGFDHTSGGSNVTGTIDEDGNIVDITGLTQNTAYDFYLFAACTGGNTDTIGPETITTKVYVAPPANDACAGAITVSNGVTTGSTEGATGGDRPQNCNTDITLQSFGTWYKYTATASSEVKFDLCSSNTDFDSQLEIFTGSCAALNCVTNEDDDDNCGDAHPTIEQNLSQGMTYYLYISGYDYDNGAFELEISQLPVGLAENGEDNKYISNSQNGDVYLNGFSDLSENNVRVFSVDGTTTNFTIEDSKLQISDKGVYVIEITDGKIYREKVIVE